MNKQQRCEMRPAVEVEPALSLRQASMEAVAHGGMSPGALVGGGDDE